MTKIHIPRNKLSITLIHDDNQKLLKYVNSGSVDLIYADMMFDCFDFSWIDRCRETLAKTGSIFVHTDQRSAAEVKIYMDNLFGKNNFVNWLIWPYDWGGRSPRRFARKHDDILWYSKSKDYKFYPERVMIPKKTAGADGLNPSGRKMKIPTDVWEDIGNFHTMDRERVKGREGKNIKWQKPERLIERIILATTDKLDLVIDPFLGTGTTAAVCQKLSRHFIGFEIDKEIYKIAVKRITARRLKLWRLK